MSEFFQETKIIKVRDTEVKVMPLAVKHISKAAKAAAPLIAAFSTGDPLDILKNADSVISLISLATGIPEDEVGDWNIAELTDVMGAVVTCNSDFFIQQALPKIQAMMKEVGVTAQEKTGGKKT